MNHRLLITAKVVRKLRSLVQGLADAGNIAVTKNAEATCEKRLSPSVAGDMLHLEKSNDGLGGGEVL
jgi:hypothetical protein